MLDSNVDKQEKMQALTSTKALKNGVCDGEGGGQGGGEGGGEGGGNNLAGGVCLSEIDNSQAKRLSWSLRQAVALTHPDRQMSRFDLGLTVATVIAGTVALGLLTRSAVLAGGMQRFDAAMMQTTADDQAQTDVNDSQADYLQKGLDVTSSFNHPRVIDAPVSDASLKLEAMRQHDSLGLAEDADQQVNPALDHVLEDEALTFDDRPLVVIKRIKMKVTAYSPDERSCGKWADGITYSGKSVWTNGMQLVAADKRILPIGSVVSIPGYADGRPVPVLDIGGKIKGNRIDVLYPTHEIARQWGVQDLEVVVYGYADE